MMAAVRVAPGLNFGRGALRQNPGAGHPERQSKVFEFVWLDLGCERH